MSAAIAGLSVGALWYSPMVFGKQWAALTDIKAGDMSAQWKSMALMLAVVFITSLGLDYLLFSQSIADLGPAVELASMVWGLIVLPVMATSIIFENKSWKLLLLNSLYQLTVMIVLSLILVHFS